MTVSAFFTDDAPECQVGIGTCLEVSADVVSGREIIVIQCAPSAISGS